MSSCFSFRHSHFTTQSHFPFTCWFVFCRRVTSTRRPFRRWYTPFPVPPHITSKSGRPPHPPTATSARGFCGALPGRACAAPSVASNVTKSVKICSMPTVSRVRHSQWDVYLRLLWRNRVLIFVLSVIQEQQRKAPNTEPRIARRTSSWFWRTAWRSESGTSPRSSSWFRMCSDWSRPRTWRRWNRSSKAFWMERLSGLQRSASRVKKKTR